MITSNIHIGLAAWSNHTFVLGERCSNAGNAYRCITAGTSTVAPTGTSADSAPGGTVHFKWLSAITYTSLQAYADARETPRTDNHDVIIWNDSLIQCVAGTEILYLSDNTTGAFTTTIRPAPGDGFRDNATTLAYDATKGVAIQLPVSTDTDVTYILVETPNVTFDGIQFKNPRQGGLSAPIAIVGANATIRNCIFDVYGRVSVKNVELAAPNVTVTNCLFIDRHSTAPQNLLGVTTGACNIINCTFVAVAAVGVNQAFYVDDTVNSGRFFRNCAVFGWDEPTYAGATNILTADHCITNSTTMGDITIDGGGNLFSKTAANQFVSVSSGGGSGFSSGFSTGFGPLGGADFRLKSTADARGAALTDTTNLPLANDIFGTRRGTSGWDIGAHEFAAPAPDRARKLTNMLGMNIHISLGSALYTTTAYVADLTYMGVRVVRDHVTTPFNSKFLDVAAAGIKFDFAVLNANPQVVANNVTAFKSAITNVGLSNIVALEHQNEPNVSLPTYNGVTTTNSVSPGFLPVAHFAADLYAALKADAATLSLPVWHVTLPGAEPNNVGMQWLTIPSSYAAGLMSVGTVYGDALNIHSYPLGYGNGTFNDPTFSNAFDKEILDEFVTTWVGGFSGYADVPTAAALPKVITEGGFPTGTPGAFGGNVTTTIQARNILTGWLQAYRQSYQYYFIYEIYDDFGMLYGMFTGVGAPKASGTYLHNFSTILQDSGGTAETFTPTVFGVTAANLPTPGGQYAVFQKSDGSRWVVIWNEVKNWDFAAGSAITVGSTNVVITFDTSAIINVFDPSVGTAAQATSTGTAVTVALTDFPKIISSAATTPVLMSPIVNVEVLRTVAASI